MESESARLEREVEETRWQLSGTLEELRGRMTPGGVVDDVIDYTRDSPAAEFLRNLRREVQENPLPLVLIGIGIAWLLLASNRTSRAAIAAADTMASSAEDIGTATSAVVSMTGEWGQQTAARLADRASDVVSTVGKRTTELAGRASDASDSLAEKAQSASAIAVATFEWAKRPFSGTSKEAAAPVSSDNPTASAITHKEDAYAAEPAYERR